jgi:hypothetical protein
MVDRPRNTLMHRACSYRLLEEGSPQNSVAAAPVDGATPIPVKRTAADAVRPSMDNAVPAAARARYLQSV